jgi:hypothetical protein
MKKSVNLSCPEIFSENITGEWLKDYVNNEK